MGIVFIWSIIKNEPYNFCTSLDDKFLKISVFFSRDKTFVTTENIFIKKNRQKKDRFRLY